MENRSSLLLMLITALKQSQFALLSVGRNRIEQKRFEIDSVCASLEADPQCGRYVELCSAGLRIVAVRKSRFVQFHLVPVRRRQQ